MNNKSKIKFKISFFIMLFLGIGLSVLFAYYIDTETRDNKLTISNTVTATFNSNGGIGGGSIKRFKGNKLGILPVATRTGYTFDGWYNNTNGTGTKITPDTLMPSSNVTYYAGWKANLNTKYIVNHYQMNIDGINYTLESSENKTGTTNSILQLSALAKTYEHFTYLEGKVNGSVETETTILADGSRKIDLYYSRNKYYLNLNGYIDGKDSIWLGRTDEDGTRRERFGNVDIYVNNKVVALNADDLYKVYYYGSTYEIKNIKSSKGRQYNGLASTSKNGLSGLVGDNLQGYSGSERATVIRLDFSTIQYNITYNLNGGSVSGNPTAYNVDTPTFILNSPTKTGYIFEGWYENADFSGNPVTSIEKGSIGNKTLYAKWSPIAYILKYDGNGSTSGTMSNQTITYGVDTYLNKNKYIKTGHSFKGWYAKRTNNTWLYQNNLTGADQKFAWAIEGAQPSGWTKHLYADGQITSKMVITSETVTMYAQWKINQYTVTFKDGFGNTLKTESVNYSADATAPNPPTKDGYVFTGWDKLFTNVTDNLIVNAKWEKLPPIMMSGPNFQNTIPYEVKTTVNNVIFKNAIPDLSSYTTDINKWDVSEKQDGSIWAWIDLNGETVKTGEKYTNGEWIALTSDAYTMYIASDSTIKANRDCSTMFKEFTGIKNITFNYFSVSDTVNMSSMFHQVGRYAPYLTIKGIDVWDVSKVEYMSKMFIYAAHNDATSFSIGDLSKWNVSNVKAMDGMFACIGESSNSDINIFDIGDIGKWNVSNVETMRGMFESAAENATIRWYIGDISYWNTSNVKDMSYMFHYVYSDVLPVVNWDLSTKVVKNPDGSTYIAWDVSNVEDISYMFYQFNKLGTNWSDAIGDISKWDVSKVRNMESTFRQAGYNSKTFNIDLSKWNVGNVENMYGVFERTGYNATTFNIGDISGWNISNVMDMWNMFLEAGCNSVTFNIGNLESWGNKLNVDVSITNMFKLAGNKAGYTPPSWY